ncbi:head maturation protease, ClpP-related [Endozoicomonas arenosclerae]|uniref:head maturation protease, ClpP-related n=1 Tax=Endozoicomonas arenosclerae TaxID=1633495 RepID=UPI000780363B|nr:head maturation protease, ClpP-related [Endozoicomonas arenosclerae]
MNKNPLNKNRAWYTLKNQSGQPAELLIYDVIGDWAGLSARQLVSNLKDLDTDEITVRINSPGGSVFDGVAIYNALRYHKAHIHVRIEGLAASIASVIAMAGDTVHMAENALLMIHNPFGWVGGDAGELRKMADMLDKTTEVIAQTYCSRCDLDLEAMLKLMDEETWFTATEAEGHGLIDTVDSPVKLAASFDLSSFMHPPQQPDPASKEESGVHALAIMTLCNQAGYPEMAESFVRQHQGIDDVKNRLSECEAIKSLCTAAHCPDRASQYIQSGKSKEQVRTELFDQLVQGDERIDNSLTPNQQDKKIQPLIDTQAVYRKRNGQSAA